MILYCQAEQLLGNFDLSIKNLYDTQRYINPANKRQTAQLYSLMGRVYSKLGDYNKGIELNDKATSIFKSLGDSASVAGCYNERGVMHYLLDEFLVAERFLQRALTINRAQRNLKEIATNLNNLCLYQGDTEKKLSFIQEAIAINKIWMHNGHWERTTTIWASNITSASNTPKLWKLCRKPMNMPIISVPRN